MRTAQRTPDAVALAVPGEDFSYQDLLDRSIEVARGLLSIGVGAGGNVGLLAPNSIEFVTGMFGASLIGALVVPLHVRATARDLAYLIPHAQLQAVLTTDRMDHHVSLRERLCDALPGLSEADSSRTLELAEVPHLRRVVMLRGSSGRGCMGAEDFLRAAECISIDTVAQLRTRVRVRDTALILYTSGTTSNPKGCMISHEAATRGSMGRALYAFPFEGEEPVVMWCPGPLLHIAALQVFLYSIGSGGTFVTDEYLDGPRAMDLINKWHPSALMAMFMSALRTVATADGLNDVDHHYVRSIMSVGLEHELLDWQSKFPRAVLINGIGMTEATGWYCMTPLSDTPELRASTVGKPVPGAQLRIIDPETGDELPDGVRGELLLKTYSMLDGYYRDPEKTAEAVDSEGWLHTGDLLTRLPSGHFVFNGRSKDMLKVGGENVPAIEVENHLATHSAVRVAEVVALPDRQLDEVPVCFVELEVGVASSEFELIEHCRGHLATYKVPRAVHFLRNDEWPTSTSKIDKSMLRKWAVQLASNATASS